MDGNISIGMLVAFQSLMVSFQQPVNTLVDFGATLQELEGDLNRLDDVLSNSLDPELEMERRDKVEKTAVETSELWYPHQKSEIISNLKGYVELQNLIFGYSPIASPLIENFSLSLQPGKRVALVGASGSGKSTLARLICGLYQPWSGKILFDGTPRSEIPREVLVNFLSLVEQDIFLFGGTVRDNLTLWDSSVPDGRLIQACQDAAIHDAVMALPGGYDGELLEGGVNLSGGQRQRLEIARALVKNLTFHGISESPFKQGFSSKPNFQ